MKLNILFCVLLAALPATAQTTASVKVPVVVTNMITAHPDFRIVNGQLYNTKLSLLWTNLELQFVSRTNGTALAKKIIREPIYEDVYLPPLKTPSSGLGERYAVPGVNSGSWEKVQKGETKKTGPTIALRNFVNYELTTEAEFKIRAMRVGAQTNGNFTIEVWDCGTPNSARVVTTNFSRTKP